MEIKIQEADLENILHQKAILSLLNTYAKDLQGYKKELQNKLYVILKVRNLY